VIEGDRLSSDTQFGNAIPSTTAIAIGLVAVIAQNHGQIVGRAKGFLTIVGYLGLW
jgi:hypothetical protein